MLASIWLLIDFLARIITIVIAKWSYNNVHKSGRHRLWQVFAILGAYSVIITIIFNYYIYNVHGVFWYGSFGLAAINIISVVGLLVVILDT
jgi:hypothetical protein